MADRAKSASPWNGSARQFQHHVPQLLLNGWANENGKVVRFYEPMPGKLVASPAAVKSTAGQINTYTANTLLRQAKDLDDLDEHGRSKIKQSHILEFILSQGIDSHYTKLALDRLTKFPEELTTDDRDQIISLIMSFKVRHPAFMAQLEEKHSKTVEETYEELTNLVGTRNFAEICSNIDFAERYVRLLENRDTVRELNPHLYEAMNIIGDKNRREYLKTFKFAPVALVGPRRAIISDVPVYESESSGEPYELFIPLSPQHVLFLFDAEREQQFSDFVRYGSLIDKVNVEMASQSIDATYATNMDECNLVKTFFAAKYKEGPTSKILTGIR